MELKYGNSRAFEISIVAAICFSICVYVITSGSIVWTFGSIVVCLMGFPGVLRAILCLNWIKTSAKILSAEELRRYLFHWTGLPSDMSQWRASIEYFTEGKAYHTDVYLKVKPKDEFNIYYRPNKPQFVCVKKGLGWDGILFLAFFSLLVLYIIDPNFFIFSVLKFLGNILSTLKEKL